MQEYEYDARTFQNPSLEDGRLYAVFFKDTVPDVGATEREGRPMFRDAEFVRIVAPGDKTNVVVRPARDDDKQRFSRQYAAFKQGDADQIIGMPLTQWPMITRAQVEEFKYFQIHTVEHLANVRDDLKSKVPGMFELSQKAQEWLAAAKSSDATALKEENKALRDRLDRLEALMGSKGPGDEDDDDGDETTTVVPPIAIKKSK